MFAFENMAGKTEPVEIIEVNEVLDEVLDDPDEMIEEDNEDPELEELVVNRWGLNASIYSILIGHGITLGYLKDMDEAAFSEIFSLAKWTGHKYALKQKLKSWPESSLYESNATVNEKSYQSSAPGPSKHPLLSSSVTKNLLEDILERNEKGKIVRNYYNKHRLLDTQHKKYLAHTVVDYYIANECYFTLSDMARFADFIAEIFPPEIAAVYYNPRDGTIGKKHPSGLLYDRFHNRNKKALLDRKRIGSSDMDYWKLLEAKAVVLSAEEIEKQNCLKNWLRNN
ncbi:uncharacterized protein LOC134215377 [Armigeres subalbatus]|uniref:uncharacterized protein LOC134215377 n=1 Tax=Armigeres subalbatus TaxID=124917 RepID=UPI002ED10728